MVNRERLHVVRHLLGVGVLDRTGWRPQPFLSASLASDHEQQYLALRYGSSDRWEDLDRDQSDGIPGFASWSLDGDMLPNLRRDDGVWVDLIPITEPLEIAEVGATKMIRMPDRRGWMVRSVVPADAAWLSELGFDVPPHPTALNLLANLRARNWPVLEEVRALAHPRLPPHALRYRIGPRYFDDPVDLFWQQGWCRRHGKSPDSRLNRVAELVAERPWLWNGSDEPPTELHELLGIESGPVITRWGLSKAVAAFDAEPSSLDELLMVVLSCEEAAELTDEVLGVELTQSIMEAGREVADLHARFYPDGIDDLLHTEVDGPDGFGSEFVLDERLADEAWWANRADPDTVLRVTAEELARLIVRHAEILEEYDSQLAPGEEG